MISSDVAVKGGEVGAFPIVGIGASAGGMEAIGDLLRHLPEKSGMAFVVFKKDDSRSRKILTELLASKTRLPVIEAEDDLPLKPDHVYISNDEAGLSVQGGKLKTGEADASSSPVDTFLTSIARECSRNSIGVILSGTGSDGASGAADIKARGGFVLVQEPCTARYPSMPDNAVRSGMVDFVLPVPEIAAELVRISKRHDKRSFHPAVTATTPYDSFFPQIFQLLQTAFGVELTGYKQGTVRRRILRRAAVSGSLESYFSLLSSNKAELHQLFTDIINTTTGFFRDAEAFEALKKHVFPALIGNGQSRDVIRMWVPACSSGEEVYSIAMLYLEFASELPRAPRLHIFATDISDKDTLVQARNGTYPESIRKHVSEERLERFFLELDGKYTVRREVRELCTFAKQNLLGDPPFSRIDLISCRNLLMYLIPAKQKRLIETFHYSLNPGGFLFLGSSEGVDAQPALFDAVDSENRIYERNSFDTFEYDEFAPPGSIAFSARAKTAAPEQWHAEVDRLLLAEFTPPAVVVSGDLEILEFRGKTGKYVQLAAGRPTFELVHMARDGLFGEIRALVSECRAGNKTTRANNVIVRDGENVSTVDILCYPLQSRKSKEVRYLIVFCDRSNFRPDMGPGSSVPSPDISGIDETSCKIQAVLRKEIVSVREHLHLMTEQYELKASELSAANQIIVASNQVLSESNLELLEAEEELLSVNSQLQNRNVQLNLLNDDLSNLINSANVPMVVLGGDLVIRRFTPAAAHTFGIRPSDIGRSIGDLRFPFRYQSLEKAIKEVLRTSRTFVREVQDADGKWLKLTIRPYLTSQREIDGCVIVLSDIDEAKCAEIKLKNLFEYTKALVETVPVAVLALDSDLMIRFANAPFYSSFGTNPEETLDKKLYEIDDGQWKVPEIMQLLETILTTRKAVESFEVSAVFERVGARTMLISGRYLKQIRTEGDVILLAITDITERKRDEERLARVAARVAESNRDLDQFATITSHDLKEPLSTVLGILRFVLESFPSNESESRSLIERAVGCANDLSFLLDHLLEFSRVTAQKARFKTVSMTSILESVTRNLEAKIEETGAVVTHSDLPDIVADEIFLSLVLQNLLTNAMKFRSADIPTIHIDARMVRDEWVFSVKDNGLGFDMSARERIFDLFARVHSKDHYPGSGVGLAICKRIIARHGGRIWVESRKGEGSTFYFSIPKKIPEQMNLDALLAGPEEN